MTGVIWEGDRGPPAILELCFPSPPIAPLGQVFFTVHMVWGVHCKKERGYPDFLCYWKNLIILGGGWGNQCFWTVRSSLPCLLEARAKVHLFSPLPPRQVRYRLGVGVGWEQNIGERSRSRQQTLAPGLAFVEVIGARGGSRQAAEQGGQPRGIRKDRERKQAPTRAGPGPGLLSSVP